MAKAKWETFSEEELKEIYFNSKTCVEFFRNMGYKMKPDSRVFDKIKDKYPWIQNYGIYNKHLEGQRFGRLTVISATEERDVCGRIKWLCECNCKNKTKVKVSTSELHENSSCGCIRREKASQRLSENFHDLTGMRFGFLEVISKSEIKSPHGVLWNCYCHNCNTLVQYPILGVNLKKKNGTKSCGCLKESFCETNLAKLFEKENTDYEKQYSFNDLIGGHSMKVKIFDTSSWVELEKKINDFLEDFANIKNMNFTNLKDNCVLCAYEGETWEEFNTRTEEFWAANRNNYDYD